MATLLSSSGTSGKNFQIMIKFSTKILKSMLPLWRNILRKFVSNKFNGNTDKRSKNNIFCFLGPSINLKSWRLKNGRGV